MISKYKKILKNKRGSWIDIFFIGIIMFALAVIIIIGWLLMSSVNDAFQTQLTQTEGQTIIQENTDRYVNTFDGIFLFVFFGSFIAVMIGVLFLDTHPAFFIISLLLLVVFCIIMAVLANAYDDIQTSAGLVTFADDFSYIPFVMEHLVHIIIFMVCAISIALYGKSRMT